jgi:multicomponent Na+:H+ antiporter subunit G
MIREIIAGFLIVGALIFMAFGVVGIFRFHNFYARILITSKAEIVGFLTMMAGIIISAGLSFFSLKVGLITVLVMLTNPIATHAVTRSAHNSGYKIRKDDA